MRKKNFFILLLIGVFGVAQAQKGQTSIAAGPLLSFPLKSETRTGKNYLRTGLGLEGLGQYNFSEKSALLLKTTLASWAYKDSVITDSVLTHYGNKRLILLTFQGGYRYQIGTSGFFINGLIGVDIDLHNRFTTRSFTLGAGKRFLMKEDRFFDAGIDLLSGRYTKTRLNMKVVFSLFRQSAKK
jgi:hypothetical protein